ncbi:MAG: hypothetical protein PHE67_12345 [Campylobacterales bacterium]|nr:hypothetical protein [Campylobacterales bacterium]
MLTYHLEVKDQTIADKIMAFFNTLPANTVKLSKEEYDEELEALIDEGFASKAIGTHEEVFARLSAKYGV